MLLNCMSLSVKNGWQDDARRVYEHLHRELFSVNTLQRPHYNRPMQPFRCSARFWGNASHHGTHFLQVQHGMFVKITNYTKLRTLFIYATPSQIQPVTGSKILWMPLRKPDISSTQRKAQPPTQERAVESKVRCLLRY